MDLGSQRALDKLVGVPACALLSLVERLRRPRALGLPRAILVILLSEAGSMVCAQPMLRSLKASYPGAILHVLVLARNRSFVELLSLIAPERILTVSDKSFGAFLRDSHRAVRTLRAAGIDTVVDCELFSRISAIYSYLSGARLRVGFHRHTLEGLYRGSFINRPVPYNPYTHIGSQFLGLAAAIESETTPVNKGRLLPERPEIVPLTFEAGAPERSSERLFQDFPSLRKRPLVLIYASGGPLPIRAWPLAYFQALAASLIREGYAIGVVGMESDRTLNQGIVEHCSSPLCVNLAGYTATIRDLVLLFQRAALLVANDGGPIHFGACRARRA